MTIWFDMDGTINDFFNVPNWLPMLRASDPTPYIVAKPRINMSALARILNRLQRDGYEIGIISWLSKTGTPEYNAEVTAAKTAWLASHLPSVKWDKIHIVPYGVPKETFCESTLDVLFDDQEAIRDKWTGLAYDVDNILKILGAY